MMLEWAEAYEKYLKASVLDENYFHSDDGLGDALGSEYKAQSSSNSNSGGTSSKNSSGSAGNTATGTDTNLDNKDRSKTTVLEDVQDMVSATGAKVDNVDNKLSSYLDATL